MREDRMEPYAKRRDKGCATDDTVRGRTLLAVRRLSVGSRLMRPCAEKVNRRHEDTTSTASKKEFGRLETEDPQKGIKVLRNPKSNKAGGS